MLDAAFGIGSFSWPKNGLAGLGQHLITNAPRAADGARPHCGQRRGARAAMRGDF